MALAAAVRGLILRRVAAFDPLKSDAFFSILWATLLTILVAGPWLASGYLFGTDWPGPRRFDFPSSLSSSAPLQFALAAVSSLVSGELAGKLFVFGVLFGAAVAAYRAVPIEGFPPRAASAAVYVLNPFVYGRLHYGQLFLLAGYALLPWVAARLRILVSDPSPSAALVAALSLTLLGVFSLHMFLLLALLFVALVATHSVLARQGALHLKRLALALVLVAGVSTVATAYWTIPLLTDRGPEGATLAGIHMSDLRAFAVVPDAHLGLIPNLLGLYGFWAEATRRFTSMKDFVPLWPAILAVLLVLCIVGAVAAFRQKRDHISAWVAALVIAAGIALVLEMGIANPTTSVVVGWLDQNFPVYRGMRDAGKWAAMLALVYSQLTALGVAAILGWIRGRGRSATSHQWIEGAAIGLFIALPMYYGNGLLFGMHGEIKPSQYPPGWYTTDRALASDSHPARALFLPWHEYLHLSFVRNQNAIVASPASTFFSIPILASSNPEVPGTAAPNDPEQVAITNLVKAGADGQWATVLAKLDVKYIVLAREVDWASFGYLAQQPGLVEIGDYGSIVLYRNSLVQ
jgi:hypothetical protein